MNADSEAKIQMLKSSLRCFVYGLFGLLPVIGLPFAFAALWISGRVRTQEKLFWNAARPYRIWGIVVTTAGTLLWFLIVSLIIFNAVTNPNNSGTQHGWE